MNSTDPVEVVESAALAEVSTIEAAPLSVQTTRELRPHPQLLSVWIWGTVVFVGPAVLAAFIVSIFADQWLIGLLGAVAGAGVMAFVTIYGRAWLARFRCRLLADGLWVDRGVWWRSETFVPRARVQHTDVQQGPIARRYGIASLKVFTAGAGHGEIEIDGLYHTDAVWLRDELLGRHGQDGV
jgi:uncharacterized protein